MKRTQKQSGKAFEYAMLKALQNCISEPYCRIVEDLPVISAYKDYELQTKERQRENLIAGAAASSQLIRFEPKLLKAQQGKATVHVSLQTDKAGISGDVRDILIRCPELNWEIGISAKHHHEALKHSRLSNQIDFGTKWFNIPCSKSYFQSIEPTFLDLRTYKSAGRLWSELKDKDKEIYLPILLAFKSEILRLDAAHPGIVAPRMVSYLIGINDFYKVVKLKGKTKIQVFNFNGTLNSSSQNIQPEIKLEKLKLPSRIVEIDFRKVQSESSTTTLEMICDAGWQLSFRLHSASSKVEPSLKFDIKLVGHPTNLETFMVGW